MSDQHSVPTNPPHAIRSRGRLLAVLGVLFVLLPLLCCCGPVWVQRTVNNRQIEQFANQLFTYPLPPQTQQVQPGTIDIGYPMTGSKCLVGASVTLVTALPQPDIEAYYADVKFPRLTPPRNDPFQPIYSPSAELVQEMEQLQEELRWARVYVEFDDHAQPDGRQHVTISIGESFFNSGLAPCR